MGNQVVISMCLIVMSHWLVEVWIRISDISVILPLPLYHMENRVCLSLGVQVAGATWRVAMRIMPGVGNLVWRTGDSQTQVRYSVAERSGGRLMSCSVYTVYVETRSTGFLVEPQNLGRQFSVVWPQNNWDSLSVVWPQNHWDSFLRFGIKTGDDGFSRFGLKTSDSGFSVWASKPTATVWWFGSQNHHDGFLVSTSKPSSL
jgi:hypothetical protein